MKSISRYIGRFAPSPTGSLHFGSLVTALASFLDARAHQGIWLVRIEDIDPPREVVGAAKQILDTLANYGLHWDSKIVWQSQRHEAYHQALSWLQQYKLCYYCDCNRARIQQLGGFYDGYCRHRQPPLTHGAIRIKQRVPVYQFNDRLFGEQKMSHQIAEEDFIIYRRDKLFAYNLAVAVDDHWQGITHIVRGADLIDTTARQLSLYRLFDWVNPEYMHIPLILNESGIKLSKQNGATGLPNKNPLPVLVEALQILGQALPECWQDATITELLEFSVVHWQPEKLPKVLSIRR